MKDPLLRSLCAALLLSLAACGGDDGGAPTTPETPTTPTTPTTPEPTLHCAP